MSESSRCKSEREQRLKDRANRPTLCRECGKTDYSAYRAARGLGPMPAHWPGCSRQGVSA